MGHSYIKMKVSGTDCSYIQDPPHMLVLDLYGGCSLLHFYELAHDLVDVST